MSKNTKNDKKDSRVDCFSCVHHRITWQPAFPYACKAMGFKSKVLPSLEVFKNSGLACQCFTPKKTNSSSHR
ncbi:MAG: uracil-DNA glycosylase [Deferribacterales bacterium]|nr:uracil-DNA glycosylase [Deferribacterales bacterium]